MILTVCFFTAFLGLAWLGTWLLTKGTGGVRLHPELVEGAVIAFILATVFLVAAIGTAVPDEEEPRVEKVKDAWDRGLVGPPGPRGLPGHEQTPDEETPAPRQSSDWNPSDVTGDTGPRYRLWIDGKTWRYW